MRSYCHGVKLPLPHPSCHVCSVARTHIRIYRFCPAPHLYRHGTPHPHLPTPPPLPTRGDVSSHCSYCSHLYCPTPPLPTRGDVSPHSSYCSYWYCPTPPLPTHDDVSSHCSHLYCPTPPLPTRGDVVSVHEDIQHCGPGEGTPINDHFVQHIVHLLGGVRRVRWEEPD